MNAAGTRAPEAARAEGTRLASGKSSRPRRRGPPEELQAAAPGGASEWRAAGAPARFPPAPPLSPHPATTPGLASGWLLRRRWVALLLLGLLAAGAADGCELVPRNLRGRRASGSAAAAASSPTSAAGESPALMTGESREGGGGWGSVGLCGGPHPREGPLPQWGARYSKAPAGGAMPSRAPSVLTAALSRSPHSGRLPITLPPSGTPLSTEPLHGARLFAL